MGLLGILQLSSLSFKYLPFPQLLQCIATKGEAVIFSVIK